MLLCLVCLFDLACFFLSSFFISLTYSCTCRWWRLTLRCGTVIIVPHTYMYMYCTLTYSTCTCTCIYIHTTSLSLTHTHSLSVSHTLSHTHSQMSTDSGIGASGGGQVTRKPYSGDGTHHRQPIKTKVYIHVHVG